MTVLRPNRGNKTFSSRLTRCVDRLLPFEFEVVHVPGRTLGMADYLSRQFTELQGASVKAETLWKEWFTVNSVYSLNNVLDSNCVTSEQGESVKCAKENYSVNRINVPSEKEPIRRRDARNSRETCKKHCSQIARKRKMSQSPLIKLLNEKVLPANYAADKLIQRVIALVKNHNKTGISRLPSPWREKFQSVSIDSREFLYMDNRLIIPQSLRQIIMCSLHYGHPGRDSMLSMIADIWWPRIHREVVDQARLCDQCLQSGKILKCILTKTSRETIWSKRTKQRGSVRFCRTFSEREKREEVLISSHRPLLWLARGKIFTPPDNEKSVRIFKTVYCTIRGTTKNKNGSGTVLVSKAFVQFCNKFGIQHVKCPVRDHRENGKIERLIRTINENLRANKQITWAKINRDYWKFYTD